MANPTTNFGWVMPTATDLVTDLPADFAVFGQGVDTSMQYLLGGTTGQVLSKTSATNMAFTWINNDQGDITGVTAGTGISGGGTSGTVTVSIDTTVTVDKTTAQTLTNKTLTTPIISSISNTGTLTLPTSTDTLVGRATTDTLTNKTLTSPALTTPTISTATTNGDLLYGTGSGALTRLGIGSSAQVLTVTGGVPVWAAAASTSFPAFSATNSADQTFSAATWTKATLNTEQFDTAGNFASNRFTPTTAGYYQISGITDIDSSNTTPTLYFILWKNGVAYQSFFVFSGMQEVTASGSVLVYFNGTTDYVELYARVSAGTGTLYSSTTRFTGIGIRS